MYCVYLTMYRGVKLPPFYIGYSTIKKVKNGYHGSVCSRAYGTIWKEEIQNSNHLFETRIISIHDTRDEAKSKEYSIQLQLKVHTNPLYCNKNINGEKFFIEYNGKNNPMFNRTHSLETRKKISQGVKGKLVGTKNYMFGRTHSDDVKMFLSIHGKQKWTVDLRKKLVYHRTLGTYITPWGDFLSSREAVNHSESWLKDYGTLRYYCVNNDHIMKGKSPIAGKSPRELGFGFIPKCG